jgi:TRAP transporter TAXI family solute receptor
MKRFSFVWLLVGAFLLGSFSLLAFGETASPSKKPMTQIMIAGSRVGHPSQVLAEAWANFINKKSPWLRATAVATAGYTASFELAMENPTKYLLAAADSSNIIGLSKDPAHKYYDKMRTIASLNPMTFLLVTYDKNLKTVADLAGKRVGIARKGAIIYPFEFGILEEHGIADKVKLAGGGWATRVSHLQDGLIDAAILAVDHIYPRNFKKGSFITELETKAPIYYISFDPQKFENLIKKTGPMALLVKIPAGALDTKTQPKDLWGGTYPCFFGADERVDQDIVYEATRIIWETRGQWKPWHAMGANVNEQFIPTYLVDMKYVHPGAKRFYDDHGIKLRDLADLLR